MWSNIGSLYEVSDRGQIRNRNTQRILKPYSNGKGYMKVFIYGRRKYVHRLVAEAFFGSSKLQVNHKNGVKGDNRLCNLEYVTAKENMVHAYQTGLRYRKNRLKESIKTLYLINNILCQ